MHTRVVKMCCLGYSKTRSTLNTRVRSVNSAHRYNVCTNIQTFADCAMRLFGVTYNSAFVWHIFRSVSARRAFNTVCVWHVCSVASVMTCLQCCLGYDMSAVLPLIWHVCSVALVMTCLQCCLCYDMSEVLPWLWRVCSVASAMTRLQCCLCYDISTITHDTFTTQDLCSSMIRL